jgi:hypothetical protein
MLKPETKYHYQSIPFFPKNQGKKEGYSCFIRYKGGVAIHFCYSYPVGCLIQDMWMGDQVFCNP